MEKQEKTKPKKFTSSFLSASRCDGKIAPSLNYISQGSNVGPNACRYTPREINKTKQPNYSFGKNKRDTNLFLFADRAGANVLENTRHDFQHYNRVMSCRNLIKPEFRRTFMKTPTDSPKKKFIKKRKLLKSAKSQRRFRTLKSVRINTQAEKGKDYINIVFHKLEFA